MLERLNNSEKCHLKDPPGLNEGAGEYLGADVKEENDKCNDRGRMCEIGRSVCGRKRAAERKVLVCQPR